MAQFPQPHARMRAPRVRIPNSESVSLKLGKHQFPATLHKLSLTGGLVELKEPIEDAPIAEIVLNTATGPINALVEMLRPSAKQGINSRPFRFIALNDQDYERLVSTLQTMRRQGLSEDGH